ncbi:putative ankyrin repeat protein [Parapoxvirus red deer/HL953]|uniref:Putative ankyrin repeat protein n=1 Tax=Parapoxvirus red deer/HL953 TaxID=1579460 RepID=A0A0A7M9S6_9POXV|nr:putative ankyrin repeat protein [Parapoxvirus red deer/HL953]AIZ77254.1 putative ankyrin repeat protein [Parapoxvirus red deer/HL953]
MESVLYDYLFARGDEARLEEVERLLALGADVNFVGVLGNTPLHVYLHQDATDVVILRRLLRAGALVDAPDSCCGAPAPELYITHTRTPSLEVFIELLHGPSAHHAHKDLLSNVLFGAVVHRPFDAMTEHIVEVLARLGADINVRGVVDRTPLHACMTGLGASEDLVMLLLRFGADVRALDVYQLTPLAVLLRSAAATPSMVSLLLAAGSETDVVDFRGNNLLHQHAESPRPRPEILAELVRAGCDPAAANMFGNTPLHLLASRSSCKRSLLQPFLDAGMSIDVLNEKYCATPVHVATGHRNDAGAAKLILAGACINTVSRSGFSPLDNMARNDLSRAMRVALRRCPDARLVACALMRAGLQRATATSRLCVAYVVAHAGAAALSESDRKLHEALVRQCLAEVATMREATFGDQCISALDVLRSAEDCLPPVAAPRSLARLCDRLAVYGPDLGARVAALRAHTMLARRCAGASRDGPLPAGPLERVLLALPGPALRALASHGGGAPFPAGRRHRRGGKARATVSRQVASSV